MTLKGIAPYLNQPCDTECPVKRAADILDGKWTTLVIRELIGGKKRFSQMVRALEGISPKVLTTRLKLLEENGLLTKTIYPTVPPKTEYELTKLGDGLIHVITAMAEFGDTLPEKKVDGETGQPLGAIPSS